MSRNDVIDAINIRQPARIPFTIEYRAETEKILRKDLLIPEDTTLSRFFGCDEFCSIWTILGKGPVFPVKSIQTPGVTTDVWGVERKKINTGTVEYWEISHYPLADAETSADIEKYHWPDADAVILPEIPAGFNFLQARGERVVLDMSCIGPFGIAWSLLGMEKMLMDMYINPSVVSATVSCIEKYTLTLMKRLCKTYPGCIDLVGCGDDYGTQTNLFLSPESIKEFFMPSLKRHYSAAARFGAKGYHHSYGAVFGIIDQFIDAGVNVLNPIQTSAAGMIPARLKKEFGSRLAFHGGIDINETLRTGSPSDVRDEVRSRINELGPNGYILAPTHVLQPDSRPENVAALYDEVRRYCI